MYNHFTKTLSSNLNLFPSNLMEDGTLLEITNWDKKDRLIDIDNLQGICIYIVYQMAYSGIISEFFLV